MFVFRDSFPPAVPLLLSVYDFLLPLEDVGRKRVLEKWPRSIPPGELPQLSESSISTTSMLLLSLLWLTIMELPFRLELPLGIALTVLGLATALLLDLLLPKLLSPDKEPERKLMVG